MAGQSRPDHELEVIEREKIKPDEPSMYKVVLLNDDYTPMEFVVDVIVKVFRKDVPTATKIMLDVHRKGAGIVGTYAYDIAVTKAEEVHRHAKAKQYPLKCRVEKD